MKGFNWNAFSCVLNLHIRPLISSMVFIAPLWKVGAILDLPCPFRHSVDMWFCHTLDDTWISLRPAGQTWSNFMWSISRMGERLHKVYNGENDVSIFSLLFLAHWIWRLTRWAYSMARLCHPSSLSTLLNNYIAKTSWPILVIFYQ